MTIVQKFKHAVTAALYPANPKCAVCKRDLIFEKGMICSRCHQVIKFIGDNACIKCGIILDEGSDSKICLRCRQTPFLFSGGVSLFVYDKISRGMILDFKYNNNPYGAYCCGSMLADKLLDTDWFKNIDIITCVPASKEAIKKRGYNQSALIADAMREKCDIIIDNQIMIKTHDSKD